MFGRLAEATKVRRAACLASLLVACGGADARPPIADDVGGASDAGASADAGADGGDGGFDDPTNPLVWTKVATLPEVRMPWVTLVDGTLYGIGFSTVSRAPAAGGAASTAPYTSSFSPADHTEGALCVVGKKAVLLGGGGNTIFGDWNVFQIDSLDLEGPTWLDPGTLPAPRHNPAAAAFGGGCAMLGGDPSTQIMGSNGALAYDVAAGTFARLAPLPEPLSSPAAAVLGSTLLVAGGRCRGEGCLGAGASDPIPTSRKAHTLDLASASATWVAAPDLPYPLHSAHAVAHGARFYVFGGWREGQPAYTSAREVLSWAPGEAAFRVDGRLPAGASVAVALADASKLYAAFAVDRDVAVWSTTPPP